MTHPDLPPVALSIRQPWAWAIMNAGKRIENRPRRFHYRGPICIHASLYMPKKADVVDLLKIQFDDDPRDWPNIHDELAFLKSESRGGIVGTAEIVDCVTESDSPWFFGPYGFVLRNVRAVPFVPVKGHLGIFNWRDRL